MCSMNIQIVRIPIQSSKLINQKAQSVMISRPKKNICITSFVFGSYQAFIPIFIYSIGRAYPTYDTKIYLTEKLDSKILGLLEKLKFFYPGFEVITNLDFPDHTKVAHDLKVDIRTFYRYIIPPKEFADYDYVYVGDVDMFILPEKPTLFDFHNAQLSSDLPINNCVRLLPNGMFSRRLTGLHFYKTEEYYRALSEIILELYSSPQKLSEFFKDLEWDEEGLYKLCASEFRLEMLKKKDCLRPWHGLHLGAASQHRPNFITEERFFNNAFRTKEECRIELESALEHDLFREIVRETKNRSLLNFVRFLGVRGLSIDLKFILWKYKLKSLLRNFS